MQWVSNGLSLYQENFSKAQVSRKLGVHRNKVSRLIKKFEEMGMIDHLKTKWSEKFN